MTNYHIDCDDVLDAVSAWPDNNFHGCLTDPPYGLNFMGKRWDHGVPSVTVWREVFRVLRPGAMLLAFGGSRTFHRLMCNIEDAGFEMRDTIMWVYGTGFPKSYDISKGIDRAAGMERRDGARVWLGGQRSRRRGGWSAGAGDGTARKTIYDIPVTDQAKLWHGYGTALKPAFEPICVAMKPLDGGFVNNALEHGCAGINVDECRVGADGGTTRSDQAPYAASGWRTGHSVVSISSGRWPANVIHDGSSEVVDRFPDVQKAGNVNLTVCKNSNPSSYDWTKSELRNPNYYNDSGSAARFFYCAKSHTNERHLGNINCLHPTLKPIRLTTYLAALIRPPSHIDSEILIPYSGAGSEIIGALKAGWKFAYGIDNDNQYCEWANSRIPAAMDMDEFNWTPVKHNPRGIKLAKPAKPEPRTIADMLRID